MVYIFLADGFEEAEAVAPIDMLRRAGLDAITVKTGAKNKTALGSHNIEIAADIHEDEIGANIPEMIVLPGGAAGVENLYNSGVVKKLIAYCAVNNIPIGAICAAPSILARMGYLKNIRATAHPTFRHYLTEGGAVLEETKKVVTDSIFTTAAAAGVSLEFGLELVRVLKGGSEADKIAEQILL